MRYDPAGPKGDQLRDTFNPLLRNLLEAELVVSVDDPAGHTWQLVEQAQRRLDTLAPGAAVPAEDLVYIDHRCWTCGEQTATYLVSERYLCAHCRREEQDLAAEAAAKEAAEAAKAEAAAAAAAAEAAGALRQVPAATGVHQSARRWARLPWSGRTGTREASAHLG